MNDEARKRNSIEKETRFPNESFLADAMIKPGTGVFLYTKNAVRINCAKFDFSRKEQDDETGFYYYGARYLNPKTSMWISADPAMGEYIPSAPAHDEARKRNGNLPGMGGVFNYVNFHVYHYAGNNPIRYIDPNGRISVDVLIKLANIAQPVIVSGLNALAATFGLAGSIYLVAWLAGFIWSLWEIGALPFLWEALFDINEWIKEKTHIPIFGDYELSIGEDGYFFKFSKKNNQNLKSLTCNSAIQILCQKTKPFLTILNRPFLTRLNP
jgi:RHS repeat-associated protein